MDSRKHLFWSVPQLGLPTFLTKNLLFGMSLDMEREKEYRDIGAHNYQYADDDSDYSEYTDESDYSECTESEEDGDDEKS